MLKKMLWATTLTAIFANPAFASDQAIAERIGQAVSAQDAGRYDEAVALYEQSIAEGLRNGHVFFNLGNAYYRIGKIGDATAAYLAAKQLLPRSPDVAANFKFARKEAVDKLQDQVGASWWSMPGFWTNYITIKELLYAGAVAIALGSCLWLGSLFLVGFGATLRLAGIGAWVMALVLGYGWMVKAAQPSAWVAVNAPTAAVYSGPNAKSHKQLFELHEAAPVLVEQEQGEWLQIQISDGKKGWIQRSSLKVF